jgi:hypothetical protein
MPTTTQNSQHLFLVRMWQEGTPPSSKAWRGSVEHVPSGQRIYFSSLRDLDDFIVLRLQNWSPQSQGEKKGEAGP